MIEKLKTFWTAFWSAFKEGYNKAFKEPLADVVQSYRDITRINLISIVIAKLNNLTNTESTFDIESDSTQAEPLQELIKDLEAKRFDITSEMLANGDCWVFPATDSDGKLYHRYVPQEDVRILNTDGERVTDVIGIIDKYIDDKDNVYLLNRRQTLNGSTLTIETYTTNATNSRVAFERWAEYESIYTFGNVDNIGVGRFKSPTSSRGTSIAYGVPLNFGCAEIEKRIFNDYAEIDTEFKNGKSIVFADPLILRKNEKFDKKSGWEIPENIFPIDTRGGQTGANVDIFSPPYRYDSLSEKLKDDLHLYEQQLGVDKGFLTPMENISGVTATEIKRANANTVATIEKIHNSLDIGIESTIKADCIFLNIAEDLYSIKIDWYDVFADPDSAYNRIKEAAKDGFAEDIDVMQWLFPNMGLDELEEKLARIQEKKQQNLVDFNLANVNGTEENAGNPFESGQGEGKQKEAPQEEDESSEKDEEKEQKQ